MIWRRYSDALTNSVSLNNSRQSMALFCVSKFVNPECFISRRSLTYTVHSREFPQEKCSKHDRASQLTTIQTNATIYTQVKLTSLQKKLWCIKKFQLFVFIHKQYVKNCTYVTDPEPETIMDSNPEPYHGSWIMDHGSTIHFGNKILMCMVKRQNEFILKASSNQEGYMQKRKQRSSLLLGWQNWFNFLPH